jgi:hypothetical protein
VSENRFLRKIFGTKRDEIIGGRGKLRNGKLHKFYSSPKIIVMTQSRRRRWVGLVAGMVEKRDPCRVSVAKTEGKGLQGKYRSRGENNNNMGFREQD